MLRAILFDLNGVLIDDEPIHLELIQKILGEEGIDPARAGDPRRWIGRQDRDAFAEAFEAAGEPVAAERIERLIARKSSYYQLRLRSDGFPPFPGASEIVYAAHDAGLMLGLVTGAQRAEAEGALEQLALRECFKAIVAAEDTERGKPHPDPYLRGLAHLNSLPPLPQRLLHPHEVLAIDDSPAGLRSAAAAGLPTLGVAQTHDPEALEAADHVVTSLAETSFEDIAQRFAQTL